MASKPRASLAWAGVLVQRVDAATGNGVAQLEPAAAFVECLHVAGRRLRQRGRYERNAQEAPENCACDTGANLTCFLRHATFSADDVLPIHGTERLS
jgi:hypothetical protein